MSASTGPSGSVALAHDYLTQRGGAERVVLSLTRAFPEAPLYTSLYDPDATFPEFGGVDVRALPLNLLAPLRRHHRLALPLLAPAFSRLQIAADVVFCSSSGWAHGCRVDGRKVVYCHAPARWLYQTSRYLGSGGSVRRTGFAVVRRRLERWDREAASSASRYLANSTWTARAIKEIYGLDSDVLHPPVTIDVRREQRPVETIEPGYILCVSRLLPYKNVESIVSALSHLPGERLVVAGDGPDEARLRRIGSDNVAYTGRIDEPELRWLYENASCLVAASYEDFGLTPLEAAAFGKPAAVLRFGGYLDTVVEGETGLFFEQPEPAEIAAALKGVLAESWDASRLRRHASSFPEERFIDRVREVAREELHARPGASQ